MPAEPERGGAPPQGTPRTLGAFLLYLWREMARQRKWLLLPLWLLLVLLGALLILSGNSYLLPVIYIAF